MLLAAADTYVCAARTAEAEYLQTVDRTLAECLIRKGIAQLCARGWLHEDGVFYVSGQELL